MIPRFSTAGCATEPEETGPGLQTMDFTGPHPAAGDDESPRAGLMQLCGKRGRFDFDLVVGPSFTQRVEKNRKPRRVNGVVDVKGNIQARDQSGYVHPDRIQRALVTGGRGLDADQISESPPFLPLKGLG